MFNTTEIKDVKVKLGQLVRRLRKQQKLTQVQMSHNLGVSRATLNNLEAGKNFTIDTLFKVLKELQLLETLDDELDRVSASLLGRPADRKFYDNPQAADKWSEPKPLY
jgi:transcriptional regulator with XRE-family HTH domain